MVPNRKKFFDQPVEATIDVIPITATIKTTGGMQIPFAVGTTTFNLNTTSTGAPSQIITSAFGSVEASSVITLSDPRGYPEISGTFNPGNNNGCYFCMPCDAILEGIKMTVTVSGTGFTSNSTTYPFVALATANDTDQNASPTFNILSSTQTIAQRPLVRSDYVGNSTVVAGEIRNVEVPITAGTLVAIVCGVIQTDILGTTQNISALSYSGVIQFR